MRLRQLLLGAGLCAVVVGSVLVVVDTELIPAVSDDPAGLVWFVIVALLAAGLGSLGGLQRASYSTDPEALPTVGRTSIPIAGQRFEETLASVSTLSDVETRDTIQERLEQVAVETLTTAGGPDAETVREQLAAGTWTADSQAAAFFSDQDPTIRERVRAVTDGTPVFQQRARRVIAELYRQAEPAATDCNETEPIEQTVDTPDETGPSGEAAGDERQ